jgi:hypothetical protein
MGRQSIPGARSKVRGKVGDTVYQIRRDGNGKQVQIVKAAEESRADNNTREQALARMTMGQVQRMFHALPQVIKDAYESTPRGTLSFQHFCRLNYPLLKQDRINHWQEFGEFDWRRKRDMTPPAGKWILADGSYPKMNYDSVEVSVVTSNNVNMHWKGVQPTWTVAQMLQKMSLALTDEIWIIYFIQIHPDYVPAVEVAKFHFNPRVHLSDIIEDVDLENLFQQFEGPECSQIFNLWDDGDLSWDMWAFSDAEYIVANAAFMRVNRDDGTCRFSSAQFEWLIDPVNPKYGVWYKMLTPRIAFLTWE